jgi:predicted RNase H-like HicB family nuclease
MPSQLAVRYLRRPYARVIIPDESGRYAAQVLEFPGCFAEGDTPEEAYKNLEQAAENWVHSAHSQGMEIPEPFATQGYSGTISLRLPKSMHRRAAEYAHRDGVSLNQFLVSAIAARVGAEDLLTVLVDRLDVRLDRFQGAQFLYMQGLALALPVANTPGTPVRASERVDLSALQESATPAQTQTRIQQLLSGKEVRHGRG